jgi:general secretion pathway protein K
MMRKEREIIEGHGFVIVVTLCMVIMLEVLLLGFNYRCRSRLQAAESLRNSYQALNCARAGLNIAITAVRDTNDIETSRKLLNLFSGEQTFSVGDCRCSVKVTEENGKLNLNVLKDKNGQLDRGKMDQMLRLIDLLNKERIDNQSSTNIGYGLVPCVIDWIDSDDLVTSLPFVKYENLGAESDYYNNLDQPYCCKNKPLEAIDELLLIKGMTAEIYQRMRDYVTVYGDGKVNINCACERVIESLSEKMDAALAQMIIERRKLKPFDSIMELRDVPGMTDGVLNAIKNIVTVMPTDRYYHVISRADMDGLSRTISSIIRMNKDTKNVEVLLYKEIPALVGQRKGNG